MEAHIRECKEDDVDILFVHMVDGNKSSGASYSDDGSMRLDFSKNGQALRIHFNPNRQTTFQFFTEIYSIIYYGDVPIKWLIVLREKAFGTSSTRISSFIKGLKEEIKS